MKALGIARSLNSQRKQTGILNCLLGLLLEEERFNDVQVHVEQLVLRAINDPLYRSVAVLWQARIWRHQDKLEEARSELSRTIGSYEKIGILADLMGDLKEELQGIEEEMDERAASD